MRPRTDELNWVYAGVESSNRTNAVRLYGILKFNEKGKLTTEWGWGLPGYTLLRGLSMDDPDGVKRRIVQEMYFNRKEDVEAGVDYSKIALMDKGTYEEAAMKASSLSYEELTRYDGIKRPITVYFLPLSGDIDHKVRTDRILVVDANGEVVVNWSQAYGWIFGWTRRFQKNRNEAKMMKDYLAECGIRLSSKDRVYRLDPKAMRDKLVQFQVTEEPNQIP